MTANGSIVFLFRGGSWGIAQLSSSAIKGRYPTRSTWFLLQACSQACGIAFPARSCMACLMALWPYGQLQYGRGGCCSGQSDIEVQRRRKSRGRCSPCLSSTILKRGLSNATQGSPASTKEPINNWVHMMALSRGFFDVLYNKSGRF